MMFNEEIRTLVDAHFEDIKICWAGFEQEEDATTYDVAKIYLLVPTPLLREFAKLKMYKKRLPNGERFWKDTDLANRLRDSDKYDGEGDVSHIGDVLAYLSGPVLVDYKVQNDGMTWMEIAEIPEYRINCEPE